MPYWTPGTPGAFPLTRTLGVWADGSLIAFGEMQDLDQKTAAAINRNGDTVAGDFLWSGANAASGPWVFSDSVTIDGGSGSPYPVLSSFASETRDFLNVYAGDSGVGMSFGLFVSNIPCISLNGLKTVYVKLDLPPGATVTSVKVSWAGVVAGSTPLTDATYEIATLNGSPDGSPTTWVKTSLSSVTSDTNGGTFLQMNTMSITPTSGSFVVDAGKTYVLIITSFVYASGTTVSELYRVRATFTPGKLQPR